jgi:transcriptional regulator with XRE-family HTH domain
VATVAKTTSTNKIDAHVGSRVLLAGVLIGMSQSALANALGLTFQQIQKYEKGINRIGAGRLLEISRLVNQPIMFFYDGLPASSERGLQPVELFPSLNNLMKGDEGIRLIVAFMAIERKAVRRNTLALIRSIADAEQP